jgi:subtilisin family serine protease
MSISFILFESLKILSMKFTFSGIFVFITLICFSQTEVPNNWFHLDPPGLSTQKLYGEFLKTKPTKKIIVAVLDSGVDYLHEDLKNKMWVNKDEISNNGIDDDKNGYIDDIHGWNFLGNSKGENIIHDNLEVTRVYGDLKTKYEGKTKSDLKKKQLEEFDLFLQTKSEVEAKQNELNEQQQFYQLIAASIAELKSELGLEDITVKDLESFETENPMLKNISTMLMSILGQGMTFKDVEKDLNDGLEQFSSQSKYFYNPEWNPRTILSGDKIYGNQNVKGPDSRHGTHVAGIIAAERNNSIGMDGVADYVEIMSVRTVPDGDERDEDVAKAIRYAADNGAHIINMSFGKGYSPDKKIVDKAIKYATKKGVLLIHAAGNDGKENDSFNNFPNTRAAKKLKNDPKLSKNWIEVGALNFELGENLPASFSNYSKNWVDVFAPGVRIYSTTPDNSYENLQGTSMAAPMVAGVAALIWSHFPDFKAYQIKEIILKSSIKSEELKNISVTGGMVNALEAYKLASVIRF